MEKYLERHPALRDDVTCALQLVYQEVLLREENGEARGLEEYLRRFPQWPTAWGRSSRFTAPWRRVCSSPPPPRRR